MIFSGISARFEVGRTHLALAELAHLGGDANGAKRYLDDAHRVFCALAVPRYIERTERMADQFGMRVPKTAPAGTRERMRRRREQRRAS